MSWIVCITFRRLVNLRLRELVVILGILCLNMIVLSIINDKLPAWYLPNFIFIITFLVGFTVLHSKGLIDRKGNIAIGFIFAVIALIIPSYLYLSPEYDGFLNNTVDRGTLYDSVIYSDGKAGLVNDKIVDMSRYEEVGVPRVRNSSMLLGVKGFDYYLHYYNNNIDKYHKELAANAESISFCYRTLSNHEILQMLNGVNVIIYPAESTYSNYCYDKYYKEVNISGNRYWMYTGDYDRTIAYTYDSAIDYKGYSALTSFDKQTLLTKACVLSSGHANSTIDNIEISQGEIEDADMYIPENVTYDGSTVDATEGLEDIVLDFDTLKESGTLYLYADNIEWLTDDTLTGYRVEGYGGSEDSWLDDRYHNSFYRLTKASHMYGGGRPMLMPLGRVSPDDGVCKVLIRFETLGKYRLQDLRVYFRKDSDIDTVISDYKDKYLDIDFDTNYINVDISDVTDRYVYLSVPYSEGWSAEIDGKPVKILRANTAFMAIDLETLNIGEHNILELRYRSPYFTLGLMLSIIGYMCILTMWVCNKYSVQRDELQTNS